MCVSGRNRFLFFRLSFFFSKMVPSKELPPPPNCRIFPEFPVNLQALGRYVVRMSFILVHCFGDNTTNDVIGSGIFIGQTVEYKTASKPLVLHEREKEGGLVTMVFDKARMFGKTIQVSNPIEGVFGAGAHTDFGLLTLIAVVRDPWPAT